MKYGINRSWKENLNDLIDDAELSFIDAQNIKHCIDGEIESQAQFLAEQWSQEETVIDESEIDAALNKISESVDDIRSAMGDL